MKPSRKPKKIKQLSTVEKAALLQAVREAMSVESISSSDPTLPKYSQHKRHQDTSLQDGRENFTEYLIADDRTTSYENIAKYLRSKSGTRRTIHGVQEFKRMSDAKEEDTFQDDLEHVRDEPSATGDTRRTIHGVLEEFKRISEAKEEDTFQDDWEHVRDEPSATSFCGFSGCFTHGFQDSSIKEDKDATMSLISPKGKCKSCSATLIGRSTHKKVTYSGALDLMAVALLVAIFFVIISWAPNIKKILYSRFGCSARPDGIMGYIDDALNAMNIE